MIVAPNPLTVLGKEELDPKVVAHTYDGQVIVDPETSGESPTKLSNVVDKQER